MCLWCAQICSKCAIAMCGWPFTECASTFMWEWGLLTLCCRLLAVRCYQKRKHRKQSGDPAPVSASSSRFPEQIPWDIHPSCSQCARNYAILRPFLSSPWASGAHTPWYVCQRLLRRHSRSPALRPALGDPWAPIASSLKETICWPSNTNDHVADTYFESEKPLTASFHNTLGLSQATEILLRFLFLSPSFRDKEDVQVCSILDGHWHFFNKYGAYTWNPAKYESMTSMNPRVYISLNKAQVSFWHATMLYDRHWETIHAHFAVPILQLHHLKMKDPSSFATHSKDIVQFYSPSVVLKNVNVL